MCGSYFFCQVLAIARYPGYSITTDYISNGGSPYANPDGWLAWMVGHVLYGIFMALLIRIVARQLQHLRPTGLRSPRGAFITGTAFMAISVTGWVLMGIVPNWHGAGWKVMHGVNAAMLLGGYHLGMIWWSTILLHSPGVSKAFARAVLLLTLAAPVGFVASQAYNIASGTESMAAAIDGTGVWFLTVPFWEWMVMFGITTAFVVLGLRLPAYIPLAETTG